MIQACTKPGWKRRTGCGAALLAASLACTLLLHPVAAWSGSEDDEIRHLLMAQFDRPDERLTVEPIVVADDVAIADWSQGDMGGRALLRRKAGTWGIFLCSGDALRHAGELAALGLPQPKATALAAELASAESKLDPARLALFARFEGTVMMDQAGAHPPTAHHHATDPRSPHDPGASQKAGGGQ